MARAPGGRRGDRNDGTGPASSFVPDGTRFMFAPQPSDKSLGYFRASLRDVESQHAKQIPHPMAYAFTVEPAHASRMVFSVPSGRLYALVDLLLND